MDLLITGTDNGEIKLFKLSTQELLFEHAQKFSAHDILLIDQHNFLFASVYGKLEHYQLKQINEKTPKMEILVVNKMEAHEKSDNLWNINLSNDKKFIFTSSDQSICVWDFKTKKLIQKIETKDTVQSFYVENNFAFAGVGSSTPTLHIFKFSKKKTVQKSFFDQPSEDNSQKESSFVLEEINSAKNELSNSRFYRIHVRGNYVFTLSSNFLFYSSFRPTKKKCILF